jgi:hypothetical protein
MERPRMTPDLWFKLASDKLIPLSLILVAAGLYKLGLPDAFCSSVGGAGLLAFQINRISPVNPSQPVQDNQP